MPRTIVAVLLLARVAIAQHPHTSWKLKPLDPPTSVLKDAPIAASDREEIYRVVEKTLQDERAAINDFRVAYIALSKQGSDALLVRGTKNWCGATGNCSTWIFVRRHG